MRKMLGKCLNLGLVALFLASLMSVATPVLAHTEADPYEAKLVIKTGKGVWPNDFTQIGTVEVWNDADNLYVAFTAAVLAETHLYVGTDPPPKGSPGQFPYASQNTYVIPLGPLGTTIYIAAHAVVQCGETAWAYGPCHSTELPRAWGWYFYYEVQ